MHDVDSHDWDGTLKGKNVQIKATGGDGTYLKEPPKEGFGDGILMVIKIDRETGAHELVYNGEIQRVWDSLENKKLDKTHSKTISLKQLQGLK